MGQLAWQDVLNDPALTDLPYKIETTGHGTIEMTPTSVAHSELQSRIGARLLAALGGRVLYELSIETADGVRVPDVAWCTDAYIADHLQEFAASSAPPLCVEILSPTNSKKEMERKARLFLDAGADEVWLVSEENSREVFQKVESLNSRFIVEW